MFLGTFPLLFSFAWFVLSYSIVLLLFCLIICYFTIIPEILAYFVMRDRTGLYLGGRGGREELGGVEGRETVIRLCYVRTNRMFNRRKKNNLSQKGII